ncbi:MAG: hypothetical protein IPI49_16260 [Myxococcales bacterium]|nr:hypothetical protein [Myxococcales bacterium]
MRLLEIAVQHEPGAAQEEVCAGAAVRRRVLRHHRLRLQERAEVDGGVVARQELLGQRR